ncbi:MAG: EamA family transporter, partial [Brevundimonas sp.]
MSRTTLLGIAGVVICAMIWGTTWYAITLQLGTVPPLASIVWRFGLASAILFLGCLIARQNLRMTRAQHLAAIGQGVFAFSISYTFTYAAEGQVASAIVAVTFASLTFLNLVLFRLA